MQCKFVVHVMAMAGVVARLVKGRRVSSGGAA